MTEQHKDPKRRLNKRRNSHRVTIPPPPQWIEAKLADLPTSSRFRLIYDANDVDALEQGPVGLSHLVRLPSSLLLPPPPAWKQFGFAVIRNEGIVIPSVGTLTSIRWQFALEWEPSRSAWDALLFSLEHLRLKVFALPPTYIVPALFATCMADRPEDDFFDATIAAWGPVLNETCQVLNPLIRALYEWWIDGPSRSAFRYRQFIEYLPTKDIEYWQFIDPWSRIIGAENLEAIRSSEHFEATIIQQLLQISTCLWTKECLPFSKQDLFTPLYGSRLSALLSLALWSPSFSGKPEADSMQLHSLNDVLQLWNHALNIE